MDPLAVAEQATTFPCDDCGGMVDLTGTITVRIQEQDGTSVEVPMTEADARTLLSSVGLPPPPVLCENHPEEGEIVMESCSPST